MALISKANIAAPVLPKETVEVSALGGEVIVRGLLLSERLALFAGIREDGNAFAHLPSMLAATVQDADGLQVFSEQEWEAFGAKHFEAALSLFAVARKLSGLDAEVAEKN